MTRRIDGERPAVVGRVSRDARQRSDRRAFGIGAKRHFKLGDEVRSLTQVRNDGTYPHRDIGEILVYQGDTGVVRESWGFLGEVYYTVEFFAHAAVVIMRGQEMARAAQRGHVRPLC